MLSRLYHLVGEDEYPPGQIRLQSRFRVVAIQDPILPNEEIVIRSRKFFPTLMASATMHAFMDEQQIRPCDGLVIETFFAVRLREPF